MIENENLLGALGSKVTELMLKYEQIFQENEELKNQIYALKAQNEAQSNQIMRLEEERKNQNLASDELLKQVEAVLGR